MKYFLIIFSVIASITGVPINNRIFGGADASPGQFPFIVALNDPLQFCDGVIIDKRWILTAAHCVDVITANNTVLVGTTTAESGGTLYNITKWIRHENFSYDTLKNDIGLVQIDGELEFNEFVQAIEFGDPAVNATCIAAGWGVTENVDFPDLQYVEVTALDLDVCNTLGGNMLDGAYLGPEQVCTLGSEGKGVCYGDSGGPLICDGNLSGIASFVIVDCAQGYPDVFTKPSAYVDWIQNIIQN